MSAFPERLLTTWRDRLLRDLHPFADPGTELKVEMVGRNLVANWVQRGSARQLTALGALEGSLRIQAEDRTDSYAGFFAGPSMGDLTGLAKMMLQAQAKDRLYIRTLAKIKDQSIESSAGEIDAVTLIKTQTLHNEEDDGTRLLVITGEPGAGKTRVLEEVVKSTATDFLEGKSTHLFLYINAQGRALARFNEALATELQDLRSLLTYHAVSTLVRLGLVVPIVDGFDELLGTGGYEDAFSSLSDFLEELDGLGAIVASARSSYYEHEFVFRANRVSSLGAHAWTQHPIEISAWSEDQFESYIGEACSGLDENTKEEVIHKIRELFKGYPELRAKPFFVSRVTDLVMNGTSFQDSGSVLERLVDAYLVREHASKLLDRNGKPLLSMSQLRQLYVELAEEMWNQETRQLDARSVRELAELVLLSENAPDGSLQTVVQRMPTMAFLSNGARRGSVAFEHETFFSYFLSARLTERLISDAYPLERLLGRAVIPEEVSDLTAESLSASSSKAVQQVFSRFSTAIRNAVFNQQVVRESGGVIALSMLHALPQFRSGDAFALSEVVVPGGSLANCQLENIAFDNVEFRRVDFCGARLTGCSAAQTNFVEIAIDAGTNLDLQNTVALENFRGLWVYSGNSSKLTYEPEEIQSALAKTGALPDQLRPQLKQVSSEVIHLLDVLARAYLRSNPVTTENNKLIALKRSDIWHDLESALVKHGILSREGRDTKGSQKVFLRRHVDIWSVLQGQLPGVTDDPRISSLWDELELRFPKKDAPVQ